MTVVRRLLALSCAIVLVDTIFYAALYPLVPYFEDELGLSKSVVGVLSGAYGAGVLAGSVPGGYLASRSGVRVTALVGLTLMAVTSVMFALADTTWLLVLARFAGGFGSALSWVAAFTWLVDRAPEERRGGVVGGGGSAPPGGGWAGAGGGGRRGGRGGGAPPPRGPPRPPSGPPPGGGGAPPGGPPSAPAP